MKRALLSIGFLTSFLLAFGQYRNLPVNAHTTKAKAMLNTSPDGRPVVEVPAVPAAATGFRAVEEEIGITNFDIQSLASMGRRIGEPSPGTIGATWQMSLVQPDWPDRGTGYNFFDGNSWGPNPTATVEGTRSGYPSYTVMEDGTEVVISHKALAAGWQLIAYTKPYGSSTWTAHILPSNVPGGNVWAKIAAGGADGKSLHVIGITLNPSFGGSEYKGMTNHPLYWRSTDGGQTWDKQDIVLPGVDSSKYLTISAESYSIEARDETVAISITDLFGDIVVMKSTDNGDTWEKHVVYDFPLDKWNGETYTEADLPTDPDAPDPLATISTDGAGTLVIDDQGKVHFFFSQLYVQGNPSDTTISVYLGTNGIAYWNEDATDFTVIAGAEDFDGDTTLTIGGTIGNYRYSNAGLASFPMASVDDEGNIYLTYQAFHELYTDGTGGNTYRHVFIIKSTDGGETWSAPFDIINEDVTEEPEFVEAAFPAIPAHTSDAIQLIYQQDYVPGLTPANVTVPDQYIMHVALDKNTFAVLSGTNEPTTTINAMSLAPNPASGSVSVRFELLQNANVEVSLMDLVGQQVERKRMDNLTAGLHHSALSLGGLAVGIYFVKIEVDGKSMTQKLVVN